MAAEGEIGWWETHMGKEGTAQVDSSVKRLACERARTVAVRKVYGAKRGFDFFFFFLCEMS